MNIADWAPVGVFTLWKAFGVADTVAPVKMPFVGNMSRFDDLFKAYCSGDDMAYVKLEKILRPELISFLGALARRNAHTLAALALLRLARSAELVPTQDFADVLRRVIPATAGAPPTGGGTGLGSRGATLIEEYYGGNDLAFIELDELWRNEFERIFDELGVWDPEDAAALVMLWVATSAAAGAPHRFSSAGKSKADDFTEWMRYELPSRAFYKVAVRGADDAYELLCLVWRAPAGGGRLDQYLRGIGSIEPEDHAQMVMMSVWRSIIKARAGAAIAAASSY